MTDVHGVTEVARGISDVGMMAVTCAFFLILSALLMVSCFKWLKGIINGIIKDLSVQLEAIKQILCANTDEMNDIAEGLRPMTELRMKNTISTYFSNALSTCCDLVAIILKENHIADHEATKAKIRTRVLRLFNTRNSHFDHIPYKGKMLSNFTNPEWVDWVSDAIFKEVYSQHATDRDKVKSNLTDVYDTIKYDFYARMKKV